MKKILKYYLPLFITIMALGFCVVLYLVGNHKEALVCVFSENCKIISLERKAIVKIDGVVSADSKVFEDERNFYLVFDYDKNGNFELREIDKNKNDVTFPVSYFEVLFSKYLILSQGTGGILLSDTTKGNGFDTQLKISDSEINFVTPEHKIEIIFKTD